MIVQVNFIIKFKNTNPLVNEKLADVKITKTGYIKESGRNIAMIGKKKDKDLSIVLLGIKNAARRREIITALLDGKDISNLLKAPVSGLNGRATKKMSIKSKKINLGSNNKYLDK